MALPLLSGRREQSQLAITILHGLVDPRNQTQANGFPRGNNATKVAHLRKQSRNDLKHQLSKSKKGGAAGGGGGLFKGEHPLSKAFQTCSSLMYPKSMRFGTVIDELETGDSQEYEHS